MEKEADQIGNDGRLKAATASPVREPSRASRKAMADAARASAQVYLEQHKISNRRGSLLDQVLSNGKIARDCTREEIEAHAAALESSAAALHRLAKSR